ncbi:MAG: S53 family peptidase, partial [Mycobacteriales bacterium]
MPRRAQVHLSVVAVLGAMLTVPSLLTAATAAPSGSSPSGWIATATKAEPAVPGEHLLGLTPAGTQVRVAVALKLRNKGALDRLVAAGRTVTTAQFASAFAPTPAEDAQVAHYLTARGFRDVAVQPGRLLVAATGTARSVDAAFHTSLSGYSIAGRTAYANTRPAEVPTALGPVVASVVGLQDVVTMTVPQAATPAREGALFRAASGPDAGHIGALYTPQHMWTFYDATHTASGRSTPIAIMAEGALSSVIAQLRLQEKAYRLPQVPVTVVPIGPASPDTSGAVEWELDTQNSTGMADGVRRLYLYDATSLTDIDTTLEFSRFAANGPGTAQFAKAGSASFGECEYQAYLDGSMLASDEAFEEAAGQGQTMFASSGDQGGFCPYADTNGIGPGGPPDTSYPATSPYVVAVGGTSLLSNSNWTYNTSVAWYTSGGGVSYFEAPAFWQSGVAPSTAAFCPPLQYALNCGRPVPDIAMDADINISPGAYFSGGSPNGQGGTSLASPLSLGSWARIEAAHAERLGFAAPLLYAAYQSPGFHDVVLGDSGPYPATPGWDFATGLGSFDVGKMAAVIAMPAPRIAGKVTYYLHGSQVVDEVGSPPIASSGYLSMDASGPSGTAKSHQITSYVLGPNTNCAGNNFFPVWLGALHGTVRGTITIKLYTVSTPA